MEYKLDDDIKRGRRGEKTNRSKMTRCQRHNYEKKKRIKVRCLIGGIVLLSGLIGYLVAWLFV